MAESVHGAETGRVFSEIDSYTGGNLLGIDDCEPFLKPRSDLLSSMVRSIVIGVSPSRNIVPGDL